MWINIENSKGSGWGFMWHHHWKITITDNVMEHLKGGF